MLGSATCNTIWKLRLEDVAPGPERLTLERLTARPWVSTAEIVAAASPNGQIIDGQLSGYADQQAPEPHLVIRAIDSTDWDIEWSDERLGREIKAVFTDARMIPLDPRLHEDGGKGFDSSRRVFGDDE